MLEKDATWVAIGFVMFLLLLVYFKVPGQITKILDSRAQKINDELEEAKKIRKEAQTVLAEFQKKNKEAEKTAKTIIEDAKKIAKNYEKEAKIKLEESLERKKKLLDEKLKRAESEAVSAIKEEVSEVVFEAVSKSITSDNIKSSSYDQMLEDGIKQIRK